MPKYKYNAVSLTGEKVEGEYTANDVEGVVTMIRSGGYYPVNILHVDDKADRVTKKKIKVKPMAGFCIQMSAMLRAGVPIAKTLEILKNQTEDAAMRKVLEDVYTKVQQGVSMYNAFSPYRENFPLIFLNMLEAGEASGTLDTCLDRAGILFTRNAKLNGKLKSAMIYPSVLLVLMAAVILLLLVFVIPTFTSLYAENSAELPALTKVLVNLSDFVVKRWYILVLIVIIIVVCVNLWLSTDKGRTAFDKAKLGIPVVSKLLIKVYAARYARTLSSMHTAGVPLIHALDVVARSISNRYIENGLYTVAEAVNRGEELSTQLEQLGVLPPMIVYMTRLGEESGTMDTLLSQAADFYDNESDTALQALTAMLEPLMIILMAALVLPVVLAIIMPVFNMYNMIS